MQLRLERSRRAHTKCRHSSVALDSALPPSQVHPRISRVVVRAHLCVNRLRDPITDGRRHFLCWPYVQKIAVVSASTHFTGTTMSTRPTNLSMSMQLSFTDAYSILHASTWGKADQESAFIKSERIEVPLEDDLSRTESCKYERLDLGPNVGFLPDRKTKIMVREDYHAIWKCVEDDRSTPGREFGGTVLTGHPGIGTCQV